MKLARKAPSRTSRPTVNAAKRPQVSSQPGRVALWTKATPIQFSLKVNAPGDVYEQEADRVADAVMRMPEPAVQRKTCACGKAAGPDGMCEDCKRKELNIQRKATGEGAQTAVPPIVHQVLQQPGQPLDGPTRNFMEARFGQDFGGVRVHTDGVAAISAEAVDAKAYTVGQDVAFNQGEFRPETLEGRQLLAHELVHSLQQSGEQLTAVTPAIGPSLFRKDDAKEDPTKKTKLSLKAQKAFWDDLHAFFPNEGRKLAGSGYDPSVSHLEVSFLEGLIGDVSHSPPSMKVGKDYLGEKDADKRKAWIKAEIQKINKWRVDTGRIDDQDVGDADVTKWIDKLDLSGKLGVLRKMEVRKDVANAKMQEFVRNRIHSTPLMAGAVTQAGGGFEIQFENVKIIVKPDVLNSSQASSGAETAIEPVGSPNFGYPGYNWDKNNKISKIDFTPTVPQVTYEIQTHYAPGVDPNATSGYGVGTRSTDTGEQKKLRFHEGSHGSVFIREVKANIGSNRYPTWNGKLGQSRKDFEKHLKEYRAGIKAFQDMLAKALETSTQEVDCVGKTIEQHHKAKGTTTKVKCKP